MALLYHGATNSFTYILPAVPTVIYLGSKEPHICWLGITIEGPVEPSAGSLSLLHLQSRHSVQTFASLEVVSLRGGTVSWNIVSRSFSPSLMFRHGHSSDFISLTLSWVLQQQSCCRNTHHLPQRNPPVPTCCSSNPVTIN